MKLTKRQKQRVGRIFEDIGKLIIGIHVVGIFVVPKIIDLPKIVLATGVSLIFFVIALIIDKEE